MKKSKILLSLACLSMLLVACNGKGSASSDSQPASSGSQSQPSTSQPTSSSQGGGASSSSSAASSSSASSSSSSSSQAAHEHDFQAVGEAVKNSAGKDVKLSACACGAKMISIDFKDYTTCGGTDGTNPWYMKKGQSLTWNINVDKEIKGATLYLGLIATSSDHLGRHLYNEAKEDAKHEGEAGYEKQNTGGTPDTLEQDDTRFTIDVGDKNYPLTNKKTMAENGAVQNQVCYVDVTSIDLAAGDNVLKYTQGLKIGYRMRLNGEVRIVYQGDAKPVAAPQGYTVTFVTSHAKAMVYESGKDYTKAPVESTTTKTRDENGNIAEYVAEDVDAGIAEVKPQVNFQIVCDEGYEFDDGIDRSTLEADATDPTIKSVDVKPNKVSWIEPADNYNKLKLIEKTNTDGSVVYYYRTTKVKGELTITLNAVQPVAQPTGAFRGLAKLASGDNDFLPIDLVLAADAVSSFHVNGEAVTVTSYAWNGLKSELTIVTEGAYGTVKATFKDNVFTITGLTGEAAALLDLTYAVKLSGNCQFLDCEQDTATLQQMFLRRKMGNSGWEAANADDKIFSSDNGKYGKGLSVKCWADGKIALALKNDLNIPAKNIKSVGCWIYNPSATKYSTTLYFYKGTGYSNNQQAKNIDLPAGAWTFVQCGVSGLLGENDTFQNFQFYTEKVNTTLVFDNFCLYM